MLLDAIPVFARSASAGTPSNKFYYLLYKNKFTFIWTIITDVVCDIIVIIY